MRVVNQCVPLNCVTYDGDSNISISISNLMFQVNIEQTFCCSFYPSNNSIEYSIFICTAPVAILINPFHIQVESVDIGLQENSFYGVWITSLINIIVVKLKEDWIQVVGDSEASIVFGAQVSIFLMFNSMKWHDIHLCLHRADQPHNSLEM